LEVGYLAPAPTGKIVRNATWDVGEEGQTAQRWQAVGSEPSGGLTCLKLQNVQQSADWDSPRADRSRLAAPRYLVDSSAAQCPPRKSNAIIEHRDPARETATATNRGALRVAEPREVSDLDVRGLAQGFCQGPHKFS